MVLRLRFIGLLVVLCQSANLLADAGPIYLRARSDTLSRIIVMDSTDPKKAEVQYDLTPDQFVVCERTEKGFCVISGLASDGTAKTFYLKLEDSKLERIKSQDVKIHMALDSDRMTTAYEGIRDYQNRHADCPAGAHCAWPNGGAEVGLSQTQMVEARDLHGDGYRWEMAYRISGKYNPRNSRGEIIEYSKEFQGWVADQFIASDLAIVSETPKLPLPQKPCPPPLPPSAALSKLGEDVRAIHQHLSEEEDRLAWQIVERKIQPLVGECRMPENFQSVRSVSVERKPAFTSVMVPYWEQKSAEWRENPPSPVTVPGSQKRLDINQLVAIDTLARTLYGEMDRCFENSLGYPKAVAKVTLNRVEALETPSGKKFRFENGTKAHAPSWLKDNGFLSVLLDPKQYSTWNNNDNNLKRVLCPPTKSQNRDPKGLAIWRQAVQIAIETVLDPEKLRKEAKDVRGFYYTSGIPFLAGFHSYSSSIDGKTLDSRRCIILWEK
jgi:hypothetical protein